MKKVILKQFGSELGHAIVEDDKAQEMIEIYLSNYKGLPERWVLHKDESGSEPYVESEVIEERVIEVSPAIEQVLISEAIPATPAVMDDAGNIVQAEIPETPAVYSDFIPAKTQKEVKLKQEYYCEIIDVTAQVNQEKINQESLKYLADTDWYIIREVDSGVQCPPDIKQARAEARARVVK